MVHPLMRAYVALPLGRGRLDQAEEKVVRAYRHYQETRQEYRPEPDHGWWRVTLAAHDDAVRQALAHERAVVTQLGDRGSGTCPPR
jgi:hypothetical protein